MLHTTFMPGSLTRFPRIAAPSDPCYPPVVVNALTVDVEDYFQVSAFDGIVDRHRWDSLESRVRRNTERLLDLFNRRGVRATFFVLGWVADRFPSLVRLIAAGGHEVASHGYEHRLVYNMTRAAFAEDLHRARVAIESASGMSVVGYRAPSYSITRRSLWALDVLAEQDYLYDSSIFPILRDRYGIPGAPRHPYPITRAAGVVWEMPPATVRRFGMTLPVAGGGYFRLFPYEWTRRGLAWINERERKPAIVYLHPWEIDPDQPRVPVTGVNRFRHYVNLSRTEGRLIRLLRDFPFATMSTVLGLYGREAANPAPVVASGLAVGAPAC
jgi:polysaccharide deacetylase family protein (PEP-CTERM system associated)